MRALLTACMIVAALLLAFPAVYLFGYIIERMPR